MVCPVVLAAAAQPDSLILAPAARVELAPQDRGLMAAAQTAKPTTLVLLVVVVVVPVD